MLAVVRSLAVELTRCHDSQLKLVGSIRWFDRRMNPVCRRDLCPGQNRLRLARWQVQIAEIEQLTRCLPSETARLRVHPSGLYRLFVYPS